MVFKAYPREQTDLQIITVALTAVAVLLLIWRITSTVRGRGWLGLEDMFVIASTVWLIVLAAMIYKSTTYGFGKHVKEIESEGGDVKQAIKYFWLTQTFYTLTNGFNKMAFVALYYRIFPMKGFRQACVVLMAISVAWTISYVFVCIFQCTPVQRVYDREIPGTCISFAGHRWSNAISNLATDLTIFILPMPVVIRLKMSIGQKIGLVVLFSVGFFICLTTGLRMATLSLSLKAKEPTYQSVPANMWSFIEAAVGVICACLISLRKSIGALWPARWRSHKGTSSGGYQEYGNSGPSGHGLGMSRPRNGTKNSHAAGYVLEAMKGERKNRPDTYDSLSPSESQERIIEDAKAGAKVTTRSKNGSEGMGINVTTDFHVSRT